MDLKYQEKILKRQEKKIQEDLKFLYDMKERYEKYIAHNQEQLNIALRGIEVRQKELDKLAQIEIIGCEGFRKLKKIAKMD